MSQPKNIFIIACSLLVHNCFSQNLSLPEIRQPHPVTCMIASAVSVMQYFNKDISYGDVSSKVYVQQAGVTFYELQMWLKAYKFTAVVCSLETHYIPTLLSLKIPPLVALGSQPKHVVAVSGFNKSDSTFTLMDPLKGTVKLSWQDMERWQRETAFQGMLLVPDTIQWQEKIISAGLPLSQWQRQNNQYRSDALFYMAQQKTDTLEKTLLLAQSCEIEPANTSACTQYASMLIKYGFRDHAYQLLRKILLYDSTYTPAKQLKEQLDKGE